MYNRPRKSSTLTECGSVPSLPPPPDEFAPRSVDPVRVAFNRRCWDTQIYTSAWPRFTSSLVWRNCVYSDTRMDVGSMWMNHTLNALHLDATSSSAIHFSSALTTFSPFSPMGEWRGRRLQMRLVKTLWVGRSLFLSWLHEEASRSSFLSSCFSPLFLLLRSFWIFNFLGAGSVLAGPFAHPHAPLCFSAFLYHRQLYSGWIFYRLSITIDWISKRCWFSNLGNKSVLLWFHLTSVVIETDRGACHQLPPIDSGAFVRLGSFVYDVNSLLSGAA